jgi:hypothetical protein
LSTSLVLLIQSAWFPFRSPSQIPRFLSFFTLHFHANDWIEPISYHVLLPRAFRWSNMCLLGVYWLRGGDHRKQGMPLCIQDFLPLSSHGGAVLPECELAWPLTVSHSNCLLRMALHTFNEMSHAW